MQRLGTYYWVYILKDEDEARFSINFTINMKNRVRTIDEKMVYYRRFENTLDALGHKLLLEYISTDSLELIIKNQNPKQQDLKSKILQE